MWFPPLAVAACIAGNMVGNKHTVANFDAVNFATYFTNNSCSFMTQHTRCLRYTVPLQNVTTANTACNYLKQGFLFAYAWNWNFFNADVMVVIVKGSKQKNHQKERLGFACYDLGVEVVCFLDCEAFMDYGADGFD